MYRFKAIALTFLKQVAIGSSPFIVRDENDNYLLGVCTSCQADLLITGDQDLLVLGIYQGTVILNMAQFLQIILLDR